MCEPFAELEAVEMDIQQRRHTARIERVRAILQNDMVLVRYLLGEGDSLREEFTYLKDTFKHHGWDVISTPL